MLGRGRGVNVRLPAGLFQPGTALDARIRRLANKRQCRIERRHHDQTSCRKFHTLRWTDSAPAPDQDINNPLGVGGSTLHGWALATRTFQKHLFGRDGGEAGVDEEFAARGFRNIGAWILGRNMFGPVRGPWPDESWRGWWGENPV